VVVAGPAVPGQPPAGGVDLEAVTEKADAPVPGGDQVVDGAARRAPLSMMTASA
jgi:hypothetical protein